MTVVVESPEEQRALDALGERIAELSAHIEAAHYRLLQLIREFDERGGWGRAGAVSCAQWLSWRVGLGPVAAREKVRVARSLGELPRISAALRRGAISYSKARAITRVATPENEEALLVYAEHGTAAQVEKVVRTYRRVTRTEQIETENARHDARYVNTRIDDDGMLVIEGRLPPEAGALLLKALQQAEAQLPPDRKTGETDVSAEAQTPGQKRADALGLVARGALANKASSTSADHTQVVVHVDAEVLANDDAPGVCCIEGGADISAETARRLCCDAAVVTMVHDTDGNVLDVGRKTRSIPPAIRRALNTRDDTCRWPGCTHGRYLETHHVEHWARGGETKLKNLLYLCSTHHRMCHEGGFSVKRIDDRVVFLRPDGSPIPERAETIVTNPSTSIGVLEQAHPEIDSETMTTWSGDPLDYDWAIELLLQQATSTSSVEPENDLKVVSRHRVQRDLYMRTSRPSSFAAL